MSSITQVPSFGTRQLDLPYIDSDRHAVETREAAFKRERSPKLRAISDLVRETGIVGMTRDEIAVVLKLASTTPCYPVLLLVKDGELVETSRRRPTRFGSPAVVLVHRDFRTEGGESC